MTPLVDYWLKANLFLLLFYSFYALLLRRHTFLTLNRTYLLGSLALALLLPLVHIPGLTFPWPWEAADVPVYTTVSAEAITVVGVNAETDAPLLPDWPELALWAFWLVAAGLLFRTSWRAASLIRLIRQWPAQRFADHTLVLPPTAQTPTFSFFRYLVLNPDDVHTEAVRQHELVHIRQKHSLDVLLLEVVQALCWPNPALFGYWRAIRQVHEYLADRDATPQTPAHRDAYARFLVSYAFHLPGPITASDRLAHSFGPDRPDSPTLKQRIQMLHQQHTRRRALWKYALVLPLATALLAMTNVPETADEPDPVPATTKATAVVHIKGIVYDQRSRYPNSVPISGAVIVIKNGHQGATTDANGRFTIDVPINTTLVASFVGFEASEIDIPKTGNMIVVFKLKPSSVNGATMPLVDHSSSPTTMPASGRANEVFTVVESNPTFPRGMNAMTVFITKNLRYPARAKRANIQGKVLLNFLVGADGSISQIKIIKGIQFGCDDEAIRLVKEMPKWIPGIQNGQPVAVRYNLQVDFALANQVGSNQKPEPAVRVGYSSMDSLMAPMATTIQMADRVRPPGDDEKALTFELYDGSKDVVYILDGKEITKSEMSKLDPASIGSITVFKNESKPVFYKGKVRDGVVRITSKKGIKVGLRQQPPIKLPDSQVDVVVRNSPRIYYNGQTVLIPPSRFRIDGEEPLYILDGREIIKEAMDILDPNTIQSIDVLKDLSAAAIYGEKGRNGVVRITTKKGGESEKKKDR